MYKLNLYNSNENIVELNNITYNCELTNNVGTERYMAPEQLRLESYNYKVDIYAAGIMFYEMFENKKYILHDTIKFYWTSKYIRKYILLMLNNNANLRIDSLGVLKGLNNMK
jgi:serine/threonine protein kinase